MIQDAGKEEDKVKLKIVRKGDKVNVEVMLRHGDRVLSSRGTDEDIVLASVKAYLNGVNLFQSMKKEKQ